MPDLRVETIAGVGVRVTWPVGEGVTAADYFAALLPAYTREADAVGVAAAGAWVADVALHADLIARPTRLGLADGAVTVGDRSVPLRVGVELPPALVMPVTAARLVEWTEGRVDGRALVQVSASTLRAWDPGAVARMGLEDAAAAAEVERRRYFLALCRCVRETAYDAVEAAPTERAGGVALGPLAGGPVLVVGRGAAYFFEVAKTLAADVPSPAQDRARRERVAAAARAYVGRLAGYQASGRRELAAAGEVERAAAAEVERAAAGELLLWQSAAGSDATRAAREGEASGFKLGTVGKLAVGWLVVKTVLGD